MKTITVVCVGYENGHNIIASKLLFWKNCPKGRMQEIKQDRNMSAHAHSLDI